MMQNSIQGLPAEILLTIFKFVFTGSRSFNDRKLSDARSCKPGKSTWKSKEDHLNPYIFPYATSLVCKQWRDLMRLAPIFWTRLIILVDAKSTPLSEVQTHLELSRDLPLDLHVLRRPDTYAEPDPQEHRRCEPIINALLPHFKRCRLISFDVIHSSSLPSVFYEFRGHAPHLVSLQLNCRIDDGKQAPPRTLTYSDDEPFSFPSLKTLDIDGRNFADACLDLPSWEECLSQTKELRVTISNFSATSSSFTHESLLLDFVQALSSISQISLLRLVDLDLAAGRECWDGIRWPLALSHIELVDLTEQFLDDFFEFTEMELETAHCIRCPLEGCYPALDALDLTLEEIPEDSDFVYALKQWQGINLAIVDCNTFDDSAVQALHDRHTQDRLDIVGERSDFQFVNCPSITVDALKDLIKARNRALDGIYGRLCDLDVYGSGPQLSAADRVWFEEHVGVFSWQICIW